MKFEEHCIESKILFGKEYAEVHKWLDEFAFKPGIGMKHRRFRHHNSGINQIEHLFGKDAAAAARQHIISDLKMEGWTEADGFPENETDYVRKGFY